MAKTVFDVLADKVDEAKTAASDFLVGGAAKDYAAYRESVGFIRGLETCLREIEDLSRRYMDDDND